MPQTEPQGKPGRHSTGRNQTGSRPGTSHAIPPLSAVHPRPHRVAATSPATRREPKPRPPNPDRPRCARCLIAWDGPRQCWVHCCIAPASRPLACCCCRRKRRRPCAQTAKQPTATSHPQPLSRQPWPPRCLRSNWSASGALPRTRRAWRASACCRRCSRWRPCRASSGAPPRRPRPPAAPRAPPRAPTPPRAACAGAPAALRARIQAALQHKA